MKVKINTLTPELFLSLYTSVGWEPPCVEQVKKALENTIATFTAYDNDTPVGMVRLIGDWAVSLELISSKEAVDFYKKKGFEERPCNWDGPGMFKMLR